MKINELLENIEDTPFSYIKRLNAEFKDLAKNYDLTLVAGMGWPQITVQGGWFGGGLGNKGGQNKKEDTLSLPVETRRIGFLKKLAIKLEELMKAGHTVKVAAGAERSKHQEDVKPGTAYEQLKAALQVNTPPGNLHGNSRLPIECVAWFVSLPPDLAGNVTMIFTGSIVGAPSPGEPGTYSHERLRADLVFKMERKAGLELIRKVTEFLGSQSGKNYYKNGKTYSGGFQTTTYVKFLHQVGAFMEKVTGAPPPKDPSLTSSYFGIDKGAPSSSAWRLNPEQVEELLALFKRFT